MNVPLMPKLPPESEADEAIHDREGHEFVDGRWVPKSPEEPPEIDDKEGCEFIDGEWVEKTMGAEADLIGLALASLLREYVRAHGIGLVFGPECAYQVFPAQPRKTRKPDVSF